uniref:Uncharacterized protein n=1 Tax=Aegilops tauschii subsp. strangulata TaxID=200361 RepID=A0A452XPQ1_AEGTS
MDRVPCTIVALYITRWFVQSLAPSISIHLRLATQTTFSFSSFFRVVGRSPGRSRRRRLQRGSSSVHRTNRPAMCNNSGGRGGAMAARKGPWTENEDAQLVSGAPARAAASAGSTTSTRASSADASPPTRSGSSSASTPSGAPGGPGSLGSSPAAPTTRSRTTGGRT